jgi:HK97 gp10 family phage protein
MAFKSNFGEIRKKFTSGKEKALEAVGVFVKGETQSRCPVDTGNLRASYTHKTDARAGKVTIGSPVEYAVYVEKGTKSSAKQPHLTPAFEENMKEIEKIVKEYIKL